MDLILLILAIVYAAGRSQISSQRAEDHPDVPEEEFEKWKRNELRSRDIVIWLGFGWFAAEILILIPVVGYALSQDSPDVLNYVCPVMCLALPVMLIALVVSATFGSIARSIKKKHNIQFK